MLLFSAVAAAAVILSSCGRDCIEGNGVAATDKRELDEFTEVDLSGDYKVIFRQDPIQSVTIDADENLMAQIKTEVSNGRLRVYSDTDICDKITIAINVKELTEIDASGALELEMTNRFSTDEFGLEVSGALEARLDIEAREIHTQLSGAGEIVYRGKANSHQVDISGAGKLDAKGLTVNSCDIDVSGAAECFVHVLRQLNVKASGASSIVYSGNPGEVSQNISGATSVRPAE